jgi:hypothetical protein
MSGWGGPDALFNRGVRTLTSLGIPYEFQSGPLTQAEVASFVDRGHVTLRRAFPRAVAEQVVLSLGERLGYDLNDPKAWHQKGVWVKERLDVPPFTDAITPRFHQAVEQLVGPGRADPLTYMGWFPITFPGAPIKENWHIEGDFHHHAWSPEQALITLFMFTDVRAGDGGTRFVEGSHWTAAELLWDSEPQGLSPSDADERIGAALWRSDPPVIEAVASAGDVVILHPFMYHASNANGGTGPRVMAPPRFDMVDMKGSRSRPYPVDVATTAARDAAARRTADSETAPL